jgi:hypothetical protein
MSKTGTGQGKTAETRGVSKDHIRKRENARTALVSKQMRYQIRKNKM